MQTSTGHAPFAQRHEIARLVAIAQQQSRGDGYRGKREAPRFRSMVKLEASVESADATEVYPVTLHNISLVGIAFWIRQELEPGQDVFVREFCGGDSAVWVGAQVTHCTQGIRGFVIGAEFHHPGEAATLRELTADDEDEEALDEVEIVQPPKRRGFLSWLGLDKSDD